MSRREDLAAWFRSFSRVTMEAGDLPENHERAPFLYGLSRDAYEIAKAIESNEALNLADAEADCSLMREE